MSKITIYSNSEFGQIRTLVINEQPWFVGKDVAEVLGYTNPQKAIRDHIDEDDKRTEQIVHPFGGIQATIVINESGLYSLILASKLPKAREFKHWVTSEVLPQIRKTGGFISVSESDSESSIMAKAFMIAKRTIDMQQKLLDAQRPDVEFAHQITSCENSILIRDLAKLITQNGVPIGQGRLFYWLRLKGYLFQHERRPIQRWVEEGLFDTNVSLEDGHFEKLTTKVTPKGQRYFLDGFLSGKFKADNRSLN